MASKKKSSPASESHHPGSAPEDDSSVNTAPVLPADAEMPPASDADTSPGADDPPANMSDEPVHTSPQLPKTAESTFDGEIADFPGVTPEPDTATDADDSLSESAISAQAPTEPPAASFDQPDAPDVTPASEPPQAATPAAVAPHRPSVKKHIPHKRLGLAAGVVLFILLAVCASVIVSYNGRALPGTKLGGIDVSGKTKAQLRTIADQQAAKIRLTFVSKDKSATTAPTPAGINFDPAGSARDAASAKRDSWLNALAFWRTRNVPLRYSINRTALDAYLTKNVMVGWKLPTDASLVFNSQTKRYDVTDPIPGEGVHMYQVTTTLDKAALQPSTIPIPVKPIPANPAIGLAAAKKAQKTANGYLASDIQMFHNGQRVFFLEPQEIDTLIDIIPSKEKKSILVSVNADRVQKFVDSDITSTIAQAARDKVTITNPSIGEVLVLQEGTPGQKLVNNTGLAGQITTALKEHKTIKPDIDVEEGSFGQKNFTGTNRWAEVNLTQQMAYMHLDDQTIMSFRISSGRAATPSDPGEWKISRKVPLQTMSGVINGEAYRVPNVPWVSYFNPDGEAFHGTYWHNNFGTPMSHGCINMTIPDAHMMYNFAYLGMRVSVHY